MTQSELYTYARRLVHATSNDWAESDLVIDLNDSLSDVWVKLKEARGVLEFEDRNYNDLPSGTFDLVSGTASYKITVDENSNEIITVHKVAVKDTVGNWVDIPRKKVNEPDQDGLLDGTSDTSSMPEFYYEVGDRVAFSPIPNRNGDESVKIWYDRGPKKFSVGGTTFEPGIPSIYHALIAEKAALKYCIINDKASSKNIKFLVDDGEQRLMKYEGSRRHDETGTMVVHQIDTR